MKHNAELKPIGNFERKLFIEVEWLAMIIENQEFVDPVAGKEINHAQQVHNRKTRTVCHRQKHNDKHRGVFIFHAQLGTHINTFVVLLSDLSCLFRVACALAVPTPSQELFQHL